MKESEVRIKYKIPFMKASREQAEGNCNRKDHRVRVWTEGENVRMGERTGERIVEKDV